MDLIKEKENNNKKNTIKRENKNTTEKENKDIIKRDKKNIIEKENNNNNKTTIEKKEVTMEKDLIECPKE